MVSGKFVKEAEALMKSKCDEKRKAGTLSKVHEESHMSAVATFGAVTGRALIQGHKWKFPALSTPESVEANINLIKIAGYLHDCERESTERVPHGEASARFVIKHWKENWKKPVKLYENNEYIWPSDLGMIYKAIKYHEGSFKDTLSRFGDPLADIQSPQGAITSIIAHSIVTGDKAFEASGYRVLERRAFFVGKERTMFGDLKNIFTYPDESYLSVLGETIIRLYTRNPIDEYPAWLKPFAEGWHAVQYQLYKGLLISMEATEDEVAEFFLKRKFPKFDQKLVDRIKTEQHLKGKHFDETKYPVLAGEIRRLNELSTDDRLDLSVSSRLLVEDIAKEKSPEIAIEKYKSRINESPKNPKVSYYHDFFKGIIDYREGNEDFIKEIEEKIGAAVKKIANPENKE